MLVLKNGACYCCCFMNSADLRKYRFWNETHHRVCLPHLSWNRIILNGCDDLRHQRDCSLLRIAIQCLYKMRIHFYHWVRIFWKKIFLHLVINEIIGSMAEWVGMGVIVMQVIEVVVTIWIGHVLLEFGLLASEVFELIHSERETNKDILSSSLKMRAS